MRSASGVTNAGHSARVEIGREARLHDRPQRRRAKLGRDSQHERGGGQSDSGTQQVAIFSLRDGKAKNTEPDAEPEQQERTPAHPGLQFAWPA